MQNKNILSAPLIDLIFDGRNKEYGAYELRKSYAKRINKALFITTAIAALAFGGAALASTLKQKEDTYKISPDVSLIDVATTPPPEKIPEPIKKIEPPQVKTEIYTPPIIVDKEKLETPPPSIDDLSKAQIDVVKHDGPDDVGIVGPQKLDGETGIIEKKIEKEDDGGIVDIVQIEAKYVGDWKRFLEKTLNANVPVDNGASSGSYQVVIQFVVDKEGNISDIKPLTNHGFGMEQEAMRVIKKSTKWEPGIQNGYAVKAYRKQVITFQVMEE